MSLNNEGTVKIKKGYSSERRKPLTYFPNKSHLTAMRWLLAFVLHVIQNGYYNPFAS